MEELERRPRHDLETEDQIREALADLTTLILENGAKSEPVRQHLKKHKRLGDFITLAYTLLLIAGWEKEDPTSPGGVPLA